MIRKLLAAATLLAACVGAAQAQGPAAPIAPPPLTEAASFAAAADANGFLLPRAQPTIVRLSVPAVAAITPDRFRATVMYDEDEDEGKRADLEKRGDAALAKVQKSVAGIAGVKVFVGVRNFRVDAAMRCSNAGSCVPAASTARLHAELELIANSRQALVKALSEARKSTEKESALNATAISVEHSDAAFEIARRNALANGRRAVEDAASALTKEGGRWHVASIDFEEFDRSETAPPAAKPTAVVPSGPGLPSSGERAQCGCGKPHLVELRATATIMILQPLR